MWRKGRELHCDQEWGINVTKNLSQILVQSQGPSSKKSLILAFTWPQKAPDFSLWHLEAPALSLSAWLNPIPPSALPDQAQLQSPGLVCPARQSTCLPRLWAQLPESCQRGIWVFAAAQHSQCAAKEKREPSPHILVPARPRNCAGPLQLPALKCLSAAEAGGCPLIRTQLVETQKQGTALLLLAEHSPAIPLFLWQSLSALAEGGMGILEDDTARLGWRVSRSQGRMWSPKSSFAQVCLHNALWE